MRLQRSPLGRKLLPEITNRTLVGNESICDAPSTRPVKISAVRNDSSADEPNVSRIRATVGGGWGVLGVLGGSFPSTTIFWSPTGCKGSASSSVGELSGS